MSVFAMVLREPNQQVLDRLDAEYPDNFQLSPTFAVVSSDELTQSVATKVGIKGENQVQGVSGAVFILQGAYSGYTDRSLWEWLRKHEDDF